MAEAAAKAAAGKVVTKAVELRAEWQTYYLRLHLHLFNWLAKYSFYCWRGGENGPRRTLVKCCAKSSVCLWPFGLAERQRRMCLLLAESVRGSAKSNSYGHVNSATTRVLVGRIIMADWLHLNR